MKRKAIPASALKLVSPALPPDVPALGIGDWCKLTCGGPWLLVVDLDETHVTVALDCREDRLCRKVCEYHMPRRTVRRLV